MSAWRTIAEVVGPDDPDHEKIYGHDRGISQVGREKLIRLMDELYKILDVIPGLNGEELSRIADDMHLVLMRGE